MAELSADGVRVFVVWDADGKGFYLHSIWATHDAAYEVSSKLPGSWVDDAYTIQGARNDGSEEVGHQHDWYISGGYQRCYDCDAHGPVNLPEPTLNDGLGAPDGAP